MGSRTLGAALAVALAAVLTTQGCARNESGGTGGTTADQNTAATQESPQSSAPAMADTAPPSPADTSTSGSGTAAAPAGEAGAVTTAATSGAEGAKIFQTYCQTCHGATGAGDGPAAAGLNPKPASLATGSFKFDPNSNGKKGEIEDIKAIVRDGAAKYGGSPLMTPWPMLSADQLQAVAEHVQSLGGS